MRQLITRLLVVCISGLGLPLPAQAGMVATDSAMGSANRERISSVLERAEVRAQLEAYGVNVKEARARVAALTDDEAAELVARMDQLPAAGLYAVGTTILVFCLLIFMFWLKAAH